MCYLNAALHAILHCPQLTNYFLKKLHVADLNKRRKSACALTEAYADLVNAYWSENDAVVLPASGSSASVSSAFLKMYGKKFPVDRQHDAHEAMTALLKTLHDSLSKTKRIPGSKAESALDPACLKAWRAHNEGNYSILSEIFQMQIRADVRGDDGYANATYEHAMDLSVPVRSTLAEGLDALFAAETLPYRTDDGRDISVLRTQRITVLPLILIVHLMRFAPDGRKIDTFVDYPLDLDLRDRTGNPRDVYALFGVVLHSGDAQAGHYTAMCKESDRKSWVVYNDENVRALDHINECVNRNAYVLGYKRVAP